MEKQRSVGRELLKFILFSRYFSMMKCEVSWCFNYKLRIFYSLDFMASSQKKFEENESYPIDASPVKFIFPRGIDTFLYILPKKYSRDWDNFYDIVSGRVRSHNHIFIFNKKVFSPVKDFNIIGVDVFDFYMKESVLDKIVNKLNEVLNRNKPKKNTLLLISNESLDLITYYRFIEATKNLYSVYGNLSFNEMLEVFDFVLNQIECYLELFKNVDVGLSFLLIPKDNFNEIDANHLEILKHLIKDDDSIELVSSNKSLRGKQACIISKKIIDGISSSLHETIYMSNPFYYIKNDKDKQLLIETIEKTNLTNYISYNNEGLLMIKNIKGIDLKELILGLLIFMDLAKTIRFL